MPSVPEASSTKSGIATTETGDRHIPSSVRSDGTVRKERRVRPGYRPPEDVEVYKNRPAEHFKARGIPGADYADGTKVTKPSSSAEKPLKPKPKKAVKEVEKEKEVEKPVEPVDPEVEREKEAKKLAKKLRQAKELQQKKEEGGALLPEQFQKVIRISELMRQLEKLGYDLEGNKKT